MNSLECNVCQIDLDEDEHQPRHLGCSHDACTTCVKALIKNGCLECPMCREVIQVNKPEELKINHGVVQAIRVIKELKNSVNKNKKEEVTANSKDICRIHEHSLDMRCFPCKLWVCVQCKETHTADIGCEVLESHAYLRKLKEEHKQKVGPALLSLKNNLKLYSAEISNTEGENKKLEEDFAIEKKKLEENFATEKKKLEEKQKNLLEVFDEGSKTLNEIEAATNDIEKASSSMELNQRMNIYNDLQQFARIWCKKNPGPLLELLKSDKKLYGKMDIKGKSSISKLCFENGSFFLHCLRNGCNDNKSSRTNPYDEIISCLPPTRDLVFLDLTIAGQEQGRVIIRLRQDLVNYAKTIPLLFTGEQGPSLLDMKCFKDNAFDLAMNVSSITGTIDKFTKDSKAGEQVQQGSVLAYWSTVNIFHSLNISFYQGTNQPYSNQCEVFGVVEEGLDIVRRCRSHSDQKQVAVKDCGLMFNKDKLRI